MRQLSILKAGLITLVEQCDVALSLLEKPVAPDPVEDPELQEALRKAAEGNVPMFGRRDKDPDVHPSSLSE